MFLSRVTPERRVVILGSTGSIGVNALGVIDQLGDGCRVVGLSAHGNIERLLEQVKRYQPEVISVWEESAAQGDSFERHPGARQSR